MSKENRLFKCNVGELVIIGSTVIAREVGEGEVEASS